MRSCEEVWRSEPGRKWQLLLSSTIRLLSNPSVVVVVATQFSILRSAWVGPIFEAFLLLSLSLACGVAKQTLSGGSLRRAWQRLLANLLPTHHSSSGGANDTNSMLAWANWRLDDGRKCSSGRSNTLRGEFWLIGGLASSLVQLSFSLNLSCLERSERVRTSASSGSPG